MGMGMGPISPNNFSIAIGKDFFLLYFLWIGIVYFIGYKERLMIAPLSGALAIDFFCYAQTGKALFRSFLFFMMNSLFYCFFAQKLKDKAAIYFFLLSIIIILIAMALTFLKIHMPALEIRRRIPTFDL